MTYVYCWQKIESRCNLYQQICVLIVYKQAIFIYQESIVKAIFLIYVCGK